MAHVPESLLFLFATAAGMRAAAGSWFGSGHAARWIAPAARIRTLVLRALAVGVFAQRLGILVLFLELLCPLLGMDLFLLPAAR